MTKQLQREVRITAVSSSWLGRLLAGLVTLGIAVVAFVFFTALLIAAGILGLAFLLYSRHSQRETHRYPSDAVIDGEYTVESSEREHNSRIAEEPTASRADSP